jgi:hypothetical protein
MDQRFKSPSARYEAARCLSELRLTPSEFGYRMQAMFAETISILGGGIRNVARVGHPDILAYVHGRTLRIQTKATGLRSFTLEKKDLEGIRPRSTEEEGYLAVMDRGPPFWWICVPFAKAEALVDREVTLAMLRSMEDASFSRECTDAFVELVAINRDSLEAFTFSFVSKRAMSESD